jgi:DNA-binding transcriptional LysR family regulator
VTRRCLSGPAVKPPYILRTNNGDTALAVALGGQGIIAQPTFIAGDDLRAGRLAPVLPGYRPPDIDIPAIYPSRRRPGARFRVMIDYLADAFSGVPAWDGPANPR